MLFNYNAHLTGVQAVGIPTGYNTLPAPNLYLTNCSIPNSILGPPPLPISYTIINPINHPYPPTGRYTVTLKKSPKATKHPVEQQRNRILNPRKPFKLATYNVRSLMQPGQQLGLAKTMDTLDIDICCLSETRLQDPNTVIKLHTSTDATNHKYSLRLSGSPETIATGQAGVGIALSPSAESALVDWIPVNSRLCAMRLKGAFRASSRHTEERCLFVVSAYAPTDVSSDSVKDEFYFQLNELLRRARNSDVVVLAGDMNAQVGRLEVDENSLGGSHSVVARRSDNGERLLQLCLDNGLFLSSTNFRRSFRRSVTWRPPAPTQHWTQIDHIAISSRWRGCVQDCRSYWNTYVDSDHALVCARITVRFSGRPKRCTRRVDLARLAQPQVRDHYQSELTSALESSLSDNITRRWIHMRDAMQSASTLACGFTKNSRGTSWISAHSLGLLDTRKDIPAGHEHNSARKRLKAQLTASLKADRERWWSKRASEMEVASATGNSRKLFQLIRATGRKQSTSQIIRESNGELITNLPRRLDRWSEYFEHQFNWHHTSDSTAQFYASTQWAVNEDPPTLPEVSREIALLKRHKAPGPDELHPALFIDGGPALAEQLTTLLVQIWSSEELPSEWGTATIIPIFKRGQHADCSNYRGISLINIASKLLASVILRRLNPVRQQSTREEQAGFRPGRGCIDHIFTLRQLLELRHSYRRPTLLVFLDIKSAFDAVDRTVLWDCLIGNGVPGKFVNILKALYAHTFGQVRAYNEISSRFAISSGVRQGCPISPLLFNFVIDDVLKDLSATSTYNGVELLPGEPLRDLEYADDIVLICDCANGAQNALDKLTTAIRRFGLSFSFQKCKVMTFDWQAGVPTLSLGGMVLEVVEKFTYLGSCFSSVGLQDEIANRIVKARAAFVNLRHLWRRRDISLSLKGRVYNASVRTVLFYGCETWALRVEDTNKLTVFDHRCLRNIAHIWWEHRTSNEQVRFKVFGRKQYSGPASSILIRHQLRWLGHVLRMPIHRLPHRALFASTGLDWRRPAGGQRLTWRKRMKGLTAKLASVGPSRLPGWGPRQDDCTWLWTLSEMAQNRNQWRSCCDFLSN